MFFRFKSDQGTSQEPLLRVAREAQAIISERYSQRTEAQIAGTALEQVGLRDGLQIIEDHWNHGEEGLALEHLLYMIEECSLSLPSHSIQVLQTIARRMEMPDQAVLLINKARIQS